LRPVKGSFDLPGTDVPSRFRSSSMSRKKKLSGVDFDTWSEASSARVDH
jgi:hypothetical protein